MSYQTSSKMPRPFWLLIGARKLLCFPAQSEGSSLWVVSCVLTRNDTWKVPILAQNVRDIVRSLGENLTGKHAGPFAGVITVAYLKVCENIHRFTDVFWIQGDISLGFKIRQAWCGGESTRLPPFLYRYRSLCLRHMWLLRFLHVDSLPCSEKFFSGYSGQFPFP